jgi:acyl dehydratase
MSAERNRLHDAREERFGRFYDDLVPGDSFRHWPGKTITEADDHLFCLLTLAVSPLHVDAHYAAAEMPGGRNIVVGTYVYALVVGMTVSDVSGKATASLGLDHLRHVAPVYHGDTLYARTEVIDRRPSSSHPGCGIVTVDTHGVNQDEVTVIEFRRSFMVPTRERTM